MVFPEYYCIVRVGINQCCRFYKGRVTSDGTILDLDCYANTERQLHEKLIAEGLVCTGKFYFKTKE